LQLEKAGIIFSRFGNIQRKILHLGA